MSVTKLILLCAVTLFAQPVVAAHSLGQPNIVFCKSFVDKVTRHGMPMKYSEFIKWTDGEGMPVSVSRRHWDGMHDSYLNVDVIQGYVKDGTAACPDGRLIEF